MSPRAAVMIAVVCGVVYCIAVVVPWIGYAQHRSAADLAEDTWRIRHDEPQPWWRFLGSTPARWAGGLAAVVATGCAGVAWFLVSGRPKDARRLLVAACLGFVLGVGFTAAGHRGPEHPQDYAFTVEGHDLSRGVGIHLSVLAGVTAAAACAYALGATRPSEDPGGVARRRRPSSRET